MRFVRFGVVWLILGTVCYAEKPLLLVNGDFEAGLEGWSCGDGGMSGAVAEAAHGGKLGLRVTDTDPARGSSLRSSAVTVMPGKAYALRFWARTVDGNGPGVYFQFFDAAQKSLNRSELRNEIILAVPSSQKKWKQFTLCARAPENAAVLTVWVHAFNRSRGVGDLDDFALVELTEEEAKVVKTTPRPESRGRRFRTPSQERIAEIAALLPPEPHGLGRPITDRAAWDALAELKNAAGIVRAAEKYADEPPPELPDDLYLEFTKTGNRTHYQKPYGRRTRRIRALVTAECLENKGRFLSAIERDLLAMCEERSWVMPAHDSSLNNFHGRRLSVDLGSSARAWMLATATYWLGDRLSEQVRERVCNEIRRRVWEPYLNALRTGSTGHGFWWMRGTSNWNAVCNCNVIGSALALVDSRQERAEFLAGMEVSNPYFISGFADDGYCTEGVGYWNYGFGHYMMMGETVWEATGGKLSLYEDPKLPKIARYGTEIQIQPGLAPAFADCGVKARPSGTVLALIQRRFPEAVSRKIQPPGPLHGDLTHIGLFAFREDAVPPAPSPAQATSPALPVRTWFEHAAILITRSVPEAEVPFGAAFKGGHNAEHHNHNDVGSYVVALDGKAYLLDPGGEIYTRRTFSKDRYVSKMLNSYGHPVPVVAGKLQSKGREAKAEVLESAFTDERDRLVLDIRSAYDVPRLKRLVRTFEHNRTARTITVQDEVEFDSPQAFGTALITYEKVFRRAPGTFVIYDSARNLVVDVEVEGGEWTYEPEEIENPGRPSPTRLGINMDSSVGTARIRFTIRPGEVANDLPGLYHEPTDPNFKPLLEQAIHIEAEDFTKQTGGKVDVCAKTGASGKAFKYWDDEGHTLMWTFETAQPGTYAVLVRCCHARREPVTRKVLVDGNPVGNASLPLLFPDTGGWSSKEDNWRNVWLAQDANAVTVELAAGKHTLIMVNDCGAGLNLDWIRIVPVR